jgi:predicted HAD superfamily Cof-like phosphohydrolase
MTPQSKGSALSIDDALDQVRSFHRHIHAPVAEHPMLLPRHPGKALAATILVSRLAKELARSADGDKDVLLYRAAMELEELAEWLLAHGNSNLVDVADALGDRFYLLLGDSVATGLPLADLFQEIHRSNMSKLTAMHTGVGKGVKGASYKRPEIVKVLARFGYSGRE